MAAKSIEMSKLKELIRLHKEQVSNRKIGRMLGMDKKTVGKYIKLVDKDPLGLDGLLKLDDPVLEHRYTGGNAAYSEKRFQDLAGRLEYITKELGKTGVTMYLLWEEYRKDFPDGYSYTQFCFHVGQHLKAHHLSYVMKENREGGKEIFFDFTGQKLGYVDRETGEIHECEVFVSSLPASDYGFALAVPSQTIDDFVYAINKCFKAIGGAPKIIVTDNLKASVVKADRYEPDINHVMESLANHYGCVVIPARSVHPKDKALVEDQVRLVYRRVFAPLRNTTFYSIEELNKAIQECMLKHNQRRMQQYSCTREERFLAIDQPNLQPLNPNPYQIEYETMLTVGNNSHVYLGRDKHYYSVPYKYIGRRTKVIYTRDMVSIYIDGEKVAVHSRDRRPGGYTTDKKHMPSYYDDYVMASPQRYIERGYKASSLLGMIIEHIFGEHKNMVPELFYKGCDGLLHLQKVTDPILFDKACKAAIKYGQYSYRFVNQMVMTKCAGLEAGEPAEQDLFPPQDHENIRGRNYYEASYTTTTTQQYTHFK
jgi:transposase